MRAKLMSLQYFLLLTAAAQVLAQGLEVSIMTDRTIYERSDSIYITSIFKNTTGGSIKFLNKGRFEANDYCFHVYNAGDRSFYDRNMTEQEDFIILDAGAEYVSADYFHVYWPCESMPARGSWNLNINFVLNITPNENKYYKREGEKIIDTIKVNDAWTGSAVSDSVSIVIKKPE